MEEAGYNITDKEFKQISKWAENVYNIAVIVDYCLVVGAKRARSRFSIFWLTKVNPTYEFQRNLYFQQKSSALCSHLARTKRTHVLGGSHPFSTSVKSKKTPGDGLS